MHPSFIDRYLEQGRHFRLGKQRAGEMSSEELLATIGYLSQWAPDERDISLEHAHDLPPPNDGLLEG